MKKILIGATTILILSASLASCSQKRDATNPAAPINTTDSDIHIIENDATQPISENDSNNNITLPSVDDYKFKMDIDRYMSHFVNYFHEPYKAGDDLSDKNLISLSFLFALTNKDNLDFVNVDEQNQNMFIDGEGLRIVAKNLFGNNISLSDFHHYLDDFPDVYVEEQDKYIVLYARGYWGGDSYYLDNTTELQINETDNTITVTVNVEYIPELSEIESVRTMSYTFDKIVENDFLFYRINKIEEIK